MAQTLKTVLVGMYETEALAFVQKEFENRAAYVVSREGVVPTFMLSNTVLLTSEHGKVTDVTYTK